MNQHTNTLDSYSKKLRVRACGVLIQNKKILLIKHNNIGELNEFWIPPGGGIEFGEPITTAIKREFLEETNLNIEVGEFLTINEHLSTELHAIELFYKVSLIGGSLQLGHDPEHKAAQQLLTQLDFFSKKELSQIDDRALHPILKLKLITDKL